MNRPTIRYQPALDGVRALAVSAVLLFHGGVSWMTGGYLGVSVFFTLSGFLITSLLLHEHAATGTIAARAFYARRARRLLPASLVSLVAVSMMAWAGWFSGVANLRRDLLGAIFQVFNWVKLFAGESYADVTAANAGFKAPLEHYWSLAIEEQFYWLWPLAFLGIMACARRWRTHHLTIIAVLTGCAAIAAPVIAWAWGADAAYWATPARIGEILAGALVACWVYGRTLPGTLRHGAPAALAVLAVACVLFPAGRGPAYEGALPLVAAVSALLIAGLQVDGAATRLLALPPLVALGRVSYGVYLYHWPVFVLVDRQAWDLRVGVVLLLKCAITGVLAVVSYYVIERPVRTAGWLVPRRTLVAALAGTVIAAATVLLVPGTDKYYGVDETAAEQASFDTGPVAPLTPLTTSPATTAPATTVDGDAPKPVTTPPGTTVPLVPPRPVRIAVVGDSTAEATGAGLVEWAAQNPQLAQVELVTGAGCGVALGGYRVTVDGDVDIDEYCALYVAEIVPERLAELRPDVVMVLTTTWDVADRRLERGGPAYSPVDAPLAEALGARFQQLTDLFFSLGATRVVWVRAPVPIAGMLGPGDRQGDPARHEALYTLYEQMAAANPNVRVADLAGWIIDSGLELDTGARPDAVHWTRDASLRIATEFLGPSLVREALT